MRSTLSTVVALASTLQVASAGWSDAAAFSCPSNTDNHCNSQQSSGFDWSSLDLGSFSSYGGFSFDGFTCQSSFGGSSKRDSITGRTFNEKCISGTASSDVSSCPSFSCGSDSSVSAFSVDEFQISVEVDCDLEFHYGMPDGSTCKQTSSCKSSGTTVKNSQCGGAKNVAVVYPSQSGGKSSCSIGVHSVGFDCSSASSTVYQSTTKTKHTSQATTPASSAVVTTPGSAAQTTPASTPPSSSSQGVQTTPATTPGSTAAASTSTPVQSSPVTSPAVSTPESSAASSSTPPASEIITTEVVITTVTTCPVTSVQTSNGLTTTSVGLTTSTVIITSTSTICTRCEHTKTTPASQSTAAASSSVEVPSSTTVIISTPPVTTPESSAAASSSGVTTSPSGGETTVTEIVYTSTTLCPVTETHTSNGLTTTSVGVSTSTILITSTSTICTRCEQATSPALASTTAGVLTSSTSPSAPASTAPCPNILPQCLNTWLYTTGCSSNTDSDCYCPSSTFVSYIFECLSAHGASGSEIASAQTYFQGICAAHVSTNPAIITGASTITYGAAASTNAGAVATSIPVTTVNVLTTVVVPCTESTGSLSGSVIPGSSSTTVISTQLTVPQVVFTTLSGATTAAALVAGTTQAAQVAGVTTHIPAATTFSSVGVSNGTATSKSTSTSPVTFTGAASRDSMAFGSVAAAFLFAVLLV